MNRANWFDAWTRVTYAAVSTYSNRSAAQGASWRRRPTVSQGWSRVSAPTHLPQAPVCFTSRELLELSHTLLPAGITVTSVVYYRRRGPVRSLSDLNAYDPPQTMRFTAEEIAQLQAILKRRFGLDYSVEQAQDAGRAILRFYGYELLRQLQQQRPHETRQHGSSGDGRTTKQPI